MCLIITASKCWNLNPNCPRFAFFFSLDPPPQAQRVHILCVFKSIDSTFVQTSVLSLSLNTTLPKKTTLWIDAQETVSKPNTHVGNSVSSSTRVASAQQQEQKHQQALKSWLNFSWVWFDKKYKWQLWYITTITSTNTCYNFEKSYANFSLVWQPLQKWATVR